MSIAEWPAPWRDITDPSEAAGLVSELRREMSADHPLAQQPVYAVARRDDQDEVLFALENGAVAQVHLTWQVELTASWPAVEIFQNADIWRGQLSGD